MLFSVFITTTYSKANIASQVEHFIHRPVLHNFIHTLQHENRWQPWAFSTFDQKRLSNITSPLTPKTHHPKRVQNFILPGFGLHLDSFFLHDTIGTERCEDAIRAETINIDGVTTQYLSVAYCLGTRDKSFTLGSDRTSIVHIYEYANNLLQRTYTALCPVRADFACHLNFHGGKYKDKKEITLNHRVARSFYFDEEEYTLNFIKEYTRQVAHIMLDTKQNTGTHHSIPDHSIPRHEDDFSYYDIPFHMAQLATEQNGLSAKLYQRGVIALLAKRATTHEKSYTPEHTNDGYTTGEDSDITVASQRGRSEKECAGQIMRVCAFSTDFLITSWNKRQISNMLDHYGIDSSNGKCVLDERRQEFALIKSLDEQFTGVIPYFFDNNYLFNAVYQHHSNYAALISPSKRDREEYTEPTLQVTLNSSKRRMVTYPETPKENGLQKNYASMT